MTLTGFIDDAYKGKVRKKKRLEKRSGNFVLGFEDFTNRLEKRPTRIEVEKLAPFEAKVLTNLINSASPQDKREQKIWGYLTGLAAERSSEPLTLSAGDFAGMGLKQGVLVLKGEARHHMGEKMEGGKILVTGNAGSHLGQDMKGGGIKIAGTCGDYAFRNMVGGWAIIKGNAGNYLGVGNSGGRILVKGNAGSRTGWLMKRGRIRVNGAVKDYLGLIMSGGTISIGKTAGTRAGWRMKGGAIQASDYGPEVGVEKVGGKVLRRKVD